MRYYLVAVLATLLIPVLASAQCRTTPAPNPTFVPPASYPSKAAEKMFWYGTDALWTAVDDDGTWSMRGNVLKGKGYRTKLVYWGRGFDGRTEAEPKLVVTARRIDSEVPSVTAGHASAVFVPGSTPGMMTVIDIPTTGCWEITGVYRGHTLAFTVSVIP
jgi:hypothetical protein